MNLHWRLFREAAAQWSEHNAPRLGAALAYYTVLSLAPLLVVVVAVSGFAFGEDAVRGQVYWQIKGVVGSEGAMAVQTLLKAAHRPTTGLVSSIVGFFILLIGASGVFMELHDALNYVWDAPQNSGSGIWNMLRLRFFSFAMVLGIGFLLIVSLALSAVIQAAGAYASRFIATPPLVLEATNFVITFIVTSFLFALIYKLIPEVPINWSDVVAGAVVTSALFALGKFGIGVYLGKAGVGSPYGAAGSLVVLLVWVYYSAQIFLYGAEFTHVYALQRGAGRVQNVPRLVPRKSASRRP
jgi:membrane protein